MLWCVAILVVVGVALALRVRYSESLEINPAYRQVLAQQGLTSVADFLALPAVIFCGHRGRHVARVVLGDGDGAMAAFLKREYRFVWRDFLGSARLGLGFRSRACREGRWLRELGAAGIACPEFIAAGKDRRGRNFLLVRELGGACELRQLLQDQLADRPAARRRLARQLGAALARVHAAGFHHADLHAKHVFVTPGRGEIHFLDWQRSRRLPSVDRRSRVRDLAALDATLADQLASPRERLLCLRTYLRRAGRPHDFEGVLRAVCRESHRLLEKRYIREARRSCLAPGVQNLIWLDGEELCVTRAFRDALRGEEPRWLVPAPGTAARRRLRQELVSVPGAGRAVLVQRWDSRPLAWLWARLRGRPHLSAEMQQAATLFRLQRYGVHTPQLLAVGQRYASPWRIESFLLTEATPPRVALREWIRCHTRAGQEGDARSLYRRVLREAGRVLHSLHEAGCYFADPAGEPPLWVQSGANGAPAVVLGDVARLQTYRRPSPERARRDLAALGRVLTESPSVRSDRVRLVRAYLGVERGTAASRPWLRMIYHA